MPLLLPLDKNHLVLPHTTVSTIALPVNTNAKVKDGLQKCVLQQKRYITKRKLQHRIQIFKRYTHPVLAKEERDAHS